MTNLNAQELIDAFSAAILPSGKINSKWRSKYKAAGEAILAAVPDAESISEALFRLKNGNIRPVCSCGAKVSFLNKTGQYARFCSPRCGQLNAGTKSLREQTNIERYGVSNAGGFGTEQHKISILTKYNVQHPMQSDIVKTKNQNTNLKKYNVTNPFAADIVKKKIRDTNIAKYGVSNNMQRKEIKDKFRDQDGNWKPVITNFEKRRQNKLETDTKKVIERLNGKFLLLSSPKSFRYSELHTVQHLECGTIFQSPLYGGVIPRCFTCDPLLHGTSKIEIQVQQFIKDLGIEIETRRRILDGKEIDIFVPSKNIGFEINGIYWHSELNGINSKYHLDKTLIAEKNGITLVHLFEDDIRNHWNAVCSVIKSKLGLNVKIAARKCEAKQIDTALANAFCEQNHMRGKAKCQYAIGLYHNDNLIMVGTFARPRYGKSDLGDYELIRMCSTSGITIVGGVSKLMRAFAKLHAVKKILTYADRSHSTGAAYKAAGFSLRRITPPSFWYFQPNEGVRHHPSHLRKYKLERIYNDLDKTKTERELLEERGWARIWDCGQYVFEFQPQ
jgi:G:T-mismatch repair DNA endonuclease (very short patch repair protein)